MRDWAAEGRPRALMTGGARRPLGCDQVFFRVFGSPAAGGKGFLGARRAEKWGEYGVEPEKYGVDLCEC